MLCYKDTTFCSSPNCKNKCGRKFTEQDHVNALRWWGSSDYPVAYAKFCDKEGELKK